MIHFLWFRANRAGARCDPFGNVLVTWDKRLINCPNCLAWLEA